MNNLGTNNIIVITTNQPHGSISEKVRGWKFAGFTNRNHKCLYQILWQSIKYLLRSNWPTDGINPFVDSSTINLLLFSFICHLWYCNRLSCMCLLCVSVAIWSVSLTIAVKLPLGRIWLVKFCWHIEEKFKKKLLLAIALQVCFIIKSTQLGEPKNAQLQY